ncbi:TetR family transcriptional regulator [Mycolicibacterium neoaurum]|uniref:TetR/AcrR family transcriptional regulator n=1 Tax=Mycolicibacterium neoaurum TaxID=1795 RepID=UPI00248C8761|nr:TetR family transcriptional regulator [Mycolicibacterium neoaurum]WBP95013.1 TetR family transcriptional regulator [Mycolicibacterium neoaurum]WBS08689.1 TetR family transcriptional regulator [Mycolicibacterium neoaurum]
MPPDATDTKRRILVAAHAEFAQFGLSGARIDRIAETAGVNKRSIYVHFGPKEVLFDLIVARALTEMAEEVPFTPDDLPAYAGALFDYLVTTPAVLRLTVWSGLERPEPNPAEVQAYQPKVQALERQFGTAAVDTLALLLGLVTGWLTASPALRSLAAEDPMSDSRLAFHRAALVAAAAKLVDKPASAGTAGARIRAKSAR